MRSTWKTLGAISAIVLATALCAGAAPIEVATSDNLADMMNGATAGTTLNLIAGIHTLKAPVYIKNSLTVSGLINTLPTDVVITQGAPPADGCFGNAVTDGDFEASGAWTPPAIITSTPADPYSGTQYALFTRPATATTGVPDGAMDFTSATPLDLSKFPLPSTITDRFEWSTNIPAKVSPFPVTLTHSGTFPAPLPAPYVESITSAAPVNISQPRLNVWLWIPFMNPTDKLEFLVAGVAPVSFYTDVAAITTGGTFTSADAAAYASGWRIVSIDMAGHTGPTTLALKATLDPNVDKPGIIFVGAVEQGGASVADWVGAPGGTAIGLDPANFIASSTKPGGIAPPMLVTDPAFLVPLQAYAVYFGGVGRPWCGFQAKAPQQSDPGDVIDVQYNGASVDSIPVGSLVTATCSPFKETANKFAADMGTLSFVVTITPPASPALPTIFVIDEVYTTYLSDWFWNQYPVPAFSPETYNLWSGNLDSTAGWTAASANAPTLTINDIVSPANSTPPCAGANAAVFNPDTLPVPPVTLYVWVKLAQSGNAGDKLTIDINGAGAQDLITGAATVSTTYDIKQFPVTNLAGTFNVPIVFESTTSPDWVKPTIFVLGAAEARAVLLPGTDPVSPGNLATGAETPEPWFAINSLGVPNMKYSDPAPYNNPVRFGGIHQPTLKYQVTAPSAVDGTLELLFASSAYPLLTAAVGVTYCLEKEDLIPAGMLGQPAGTFGFRSIIPRHAPSPETVLELDNLCISYVSDALHDLNTSIPLCANALLTEDFEGGGWSAADSFTDPLPSTIGVSTETPVACDATNVAVFKALAPPNTQPVTLTQTSIKVPPQAAEIKFWLKITSGTQFDSFECIVNDGGVDKSEFKVTGDSTGYSGYTQPTPAIDMSSYAGQTVDLKFLATLADSATPASFAIDDVCLAAPAGAALITVGGGGSLTMNDLEVTGGGTTPAITVTALSPELASLTLLRCMIDGASAGVQFSGISTGTLASCIFYSNGVDIDNQSGSVSILQCTLRDGTPINAGAFSLTRLAASLLSSGGVNGSGSGKSYGNWISGNAFGSLTQDAAMPDIDSGSVAPVFLDSPFIGKLDILPLLQSGASYGTLTGPPLSFPAISGHSPDFKGQNRDNGNLGIGADEQAVTSTVQDWSCSLSPDVTGPNSAPVHIAISVVGGGTFPPATGSVQLRLAPEKAYWNTPGDINTAGLYIPWPVTVDPGLTTAYADVSFSASPYNGLCVDGRMSIGLDIGGGLVMPAGQPPTFIVDTVPPVLMLDSTFSITPAPAALSPGTLLLGDVHALINPSANTTLPFELAVPSAAMSCSISAYFVESLKPLDGNGVACDVTPSGFLSDPQPNSTALLTSTADAPGLAQLNGVVSNIGNVSNAAVTFSGSQAGLSAVWNIIDVQTNGDDPWNIAVKPVAFDRANNPSKVVDGNGNPVTLANALHVWWMYRVKAEFSGGTAFGTQTTTPHFDWALLPLTGPPAGAFLPLTSSVWFKVWSAPADGVSPWTPMMTTWQHTFATSIDRTTPVVIGANTVTLGDLLKDNLSSLQSKYLRIALRGQDLAGNVQPELSTDPRQFNDPAFLTAFQDWTNGASQGNVAVDTDLNVQLSHRMRATTGSDTVLRSFGSMARVPLPSLPEAKAGAYVNAQVSMGARYPEQMNSIDTWGSMHVEWKLYEDGALVAQGRMEPQAFNKPMEMALPGILLGNTSSLVNAILTPVTPPNPGAFLRAGRMGDEMTSTSPGRQRELRYMLVAQTVATIGSLTAATPQIIVDPTPATVEFSIYVREMLDKVREEQPVRIYERGQQNQ